MDSLGAEKTYRQIWIDQSWASTSFMKFNNSKCQVSSPGMGNCGYTHKLGDEGLENHSVQEKSEDLSSWLVEYKPSGYPGSQRGQPGVH